MKFIILLSKYPSMVPKYVFLPVLQAAGTQGNGIVVCSEGRVHFDSKMWENADYDVRW